MVENQLVKIIQQVLFSGFLTGTRETGQLIAIPKATKNPA